MYFNLKLFDNNIKEKLRFNFTLRKKSIGDYAQYMLTEYSQLRLTHDMFDNHYFHDISILSSHDVMGLCGDNIEISRKR